MSFNIVKKFNNVFKIALEGSIKTRNILNKKSNFITYKNELNTNYRSILLPNSCNRNMYEKLKEFKNVVPVDDTNDQKFLNDIEDPPLPNIFSFQNPYTWFVNKFDMKLLQSVWDPVFNQPDFIRGSKQAVSRVTQLASEGNTSELHGLISRRLLVELKQELSFPDTGKFWAYLGLNPTNLVVARPRRLLFQLFDGKRYSNIDMMFVGMKWLNPNKNVSGLMYLEIFARFRREYTLHCISDWTIVVLLITKCDVIARVPKP